MTRTTYRRAMAPDRSPTTGLPAARPPSRCRHVQSYLKALPPAMQLALLRLTVRG